MEIDKLQLFNSVLAKKITLFDREDETWDFIIANLEQIKAMREFESGLFYALPHGMDHFRKCFVQGFSYDPQLHLLSLMNDLCFRGEPLSLNYWARCGYLDSGDSARTRTSEQFFSKAEKNSEAAHYQKYFHLLESGDVDNILRAVEQNADKLTINTAEDIPKIIHMRDFCADHADYKVAYIYDTR